MATVVLVISLLVNTVENSALASFHTKAMFSSEPRTPMKPMSKLGEPDWSLANKITGSSTTKSTVSMAVTLPCTTKLPDTVKSEP